MMTVMVFKPFNLVVTKGMTAIAESYQEGGVATPSVDDCGFMPKFTQHNYPIRTAVYKQKGRASKQVYFAICEPFVGEAVGRMGNRISELETGKLGLTRKVVRLGFGLKKYASMGFWKRLGFLLAPRKVVAGIERETGGKGICPQDGL